MEVSHHRYIKWLDSTGIITSQIYKVTRSYVEIELEMELEMELSHHRLATLSHYFKTTISPKTDE